MNDIELYSPTAKKARVEIIPLIDVIFFLLATFVLFTLSLNKLSGLMVPLPRTGEEIISKVEDRTVYVQASEPGFAYWKQGQSGSAELLTAAEIRVRLADYRQHEATPRVLVRGDNRAKFGDMIALLDDARQAGITQVSVETLTSTTGK